jgi:hypothetical protein
MPIDPRSPEVDIALKQAAQECGLQDYYRDCVRPLLTMPVTQWPTCCGSNCQPCSLLLVLAATRICALLGIDPQDL